MKSVSRRLRLALLLAAAILLLLCAVSAAGYTTVASVNTALKNNKTVTLTQDLTDTTALVVPAGKTLDLAGYTVQTVGFTINGTVTKNDGKLIWLVSEPTKHEEGTVKDNPRHFMNAYNAVAEGGAAADVDLIRLKNNVWVSFTYKNASAAAAIPNVILSSNYVKFYPFPNAMIDLAGHDFYLASISHTIGEYFTDSVGGGKLRMYSWNTTSNDSENSRWTNSVKFLRANPQVPGSIYLSKAFAADADYDFVIPKNATLDTTVGALSVQSGYHTSITFEAGAGVEGTKGFSVSGDVILECASEADFKRSFASKATLFRLSDNVVLTGDIDLGSRPINFNGYTVSGGKLKTTGTVTYNGGGYAAVVKTAAELKSAAADSTVGGIVLGANITLTGDVELGHRTFDFDAYDLTGGTIHTTGTVFSSRGGGHIRTVYTPAEFWSTLNTMRTSGSKIKELRLGCDLDVRNKETYSKYPKVNYNGASNGTAYMWLEIPNGCKLDLLGHKLMFRPSSASLGTVVDSCANPKTGRFEGILYLYAWINASYIDPWNNACSISQKYGKVANITIDLYSVAGSLFSGKSYTVGENALLTGKAIACGTLTFRPGAGTSLIQTAGSIVYECAEPADFNRYEYTHAHIFRLTGDIRDDELVVRLGKGQTLDLNGHNLFCKDVLLADGAKIIENGGHRRLTKTVTTMAELKTALTAYTDVILNADLSDASAVINGKDFATLDLNGHSLTCKAFSVRDVDVFDSRDGIGRLTAESYTIVNDRSSQVALRDGTGYRFFRPATHVRRQAERMEDGSLRLAFSYSFANKDAYSLIASGESGLKYYVNLVCDDAPKQLFVFADALTEQYAALRLAEPDKDYVLYARLSDASAYGGEVYTDAYLANEALAQAAHTAEAGGAQKLFLPTENSDSLLDKTVGELRADNEALVREAIVRTAFAFYDRNPYTQYGMGNEDYYVKNIYTGYTAATVTSDGEEYDTKIQVGDDTFYFTSNDNAQYASVFADRPSYGVRRTLEISPEQVYADNIFFSQCSSFPHYVYADTFRTKPGVDTFTGDGTTVVFVVNSKPQTLSSVKVGTKEIPVNDGSNPNGCTYNRITGEVTFMTAPASKAKITVSYGAQKYQVYGGQSSVGGAWYGSNSDMYFDKGFDITVSAWYDPEDSRSSSYVSYFPGCTDLPTALKKMRNMKAGDVLNTAAHIMLCIGDIDNDGYIEYMHSWPVAGDTGNYGNYVGRDIYKPGKLDTPYRDAGEKKETNGALELIYWKETKWNANGDPIEAKMLIKQPLSGKVNTEQARVTVNSTAQYYLVAFSPMMSRAEYTHTGCCAGMDTCTFSEAAKTRLRMDRLVVNKWLADETGEKMIYQSQTVLPGQTATVRLQLVNRSSVGYNIPEVVETLPKGVTLVSGDLVHRDIALEPGETLDLSYKVKIGTSFKGGDTIVFPKGKVAGLESKETTIRVSDKIADAAKIAAAFKDGIPASLASRAGYETDFINLFYDSVLGETTDIPYSLSSWLVNRMDTVKTVGQISEVKGKVCTVYRPKIDAVADDTRTGLTAVQKKSLELAKLEVPMTLKGRYVALNSDVMIYQKNTDAYFCPRFDGLSRHQELGQEPFYLPGDAMICVKMKNPIYITETKLEDAAEDTEIYIYLGSGKTLKHTSAGTTVESFAKTFGNVNTEALTVVLRPLTVSSSGTSAVQELLPPLTIS